MESKLSSNPGVTSRFLISLGAAVTLLLVAGVAAAAPFQNGSFENGPAVPACNQFNIAAGNNTTITGWTVVEGNIDWENSLPCGWNASDGELSLDLVGNQTRGGVEQTFDTVPGRPYRVTFDLGGNFGAPPLVKPLVVTVAGEMHTFSFDTSNSSFEDMRWATKKVSFVATSTSTTLRFVSDLTGLDGGGNAGAALDNVRIIEGAVAPAIGVWGSVLLAALLLGLGSIPLRRRARRAAY